MFLKLADSKTYFKELKKLFEYYSQKKNISIHFKNNSIIGSGETKFNKDPSKENIKIGKKNYFIQKDPQYAFVQTLITLFHELQHVEQDEDLRDGTASPEMFYDAIATFENRGYYIKNYCYDKRELEAHISGINYAYSYLMESHPEINVFHYIKRYVEERSIFQDYSDEISKANTIEELNQFVFDRMIEDRKYLPKDVELCVDKNGKLDDFTNPLETYCYDNYVNLKADLIEIKLLGTEDVNFLSDKIVGIITRDLNPEYLPLFERNHIPMETLDDAMNEIKECLKEDPGLP